MLVSVMSHVICGPDMWSQVYRSPDRSKLIPFPLEIIHQGNTHQGIQGDSNFTGNGPGVSRESRRKTQGYGNRRCVNNR